MSSYEKNVFNLGSLVQSTVNNGRINKGDYLVIRNLCGLRPGLPASPRSHYSAQKINKEGKLIGAYITVHQKELKKPVTDKEFISNVLNIRLKKLKKERKDVENELDVVSKYKNKKEFIDSKIKEIIDSKGNREVIHNIIKTFNECIEYF